MTWEIVYVNLKEAYLMVDGKRITPAYQSGENWIDHIERYIKICNTVKDILHRIYPSCTWYISEEFGFMKFKLPGKMITIYSSLIVDQEGGFFNTKKNFPEGLESFLEEWIRN